MLTLNELARTIAELTDCTTTDAEVFLRELFALAAEDLEAEGAAEVLGLGRFVIMDGDVVFKPDAEIAEAINAPFSDFEPMELPEGLDLEGVDHDGCGEAEAEAEVLEAEQSVEPETEAEALPEPVMEAPAAVSSTPEPEPEVEEPEPEREPVPPHYVTPAPARGVSRCWLLLCAIVCLILGFIGGWFAREYYKSADVSITDIVIFESQDEEEPAAVEPVEVFENPREEVAAPASVTLDTVRPGYFLTTMSRRHYGQMDYWVYIYEANASKLGNPDRVEVGTVVVIPPADSLGLIPGNAEKIAEANRIATELYNRFN